MRAHFADSLPASPDSIDEIAAEPLEARIDEFKQDTNNMAALNEFIDEVLVKAESEATKQKSAKQPQQAKEKTRQSFAIPDFKNGKVVNRARGFVVRIFDAICNCANNATAAPTARFKLRGKRQPTQAANDAAAEGAETLTLSKPDKQKNGKGKLKAVKGVTLADEPETIEMLQD